MRSQLNRAAPLKCSLIAQVSFENNQYLRPICGSNSMMEYHGDLAVCVDCSQTRHINIRCALKRGSHLNQMTNETNVLKRQKGTEKRENLQIGHRCELVPVRSISDTGDKQPRGSIYYQKIQRTLHGSQRDSNI